jgi:hypothetical protein
MNDEVEWKGGKSGMLGRKFGHYPKGKQNTSPTFCKQKNFRNRYCGEGLM